MVESWNRLAWEGFTCWSLSFSGMKGRIWRRFSNKADTTVTQLALKCRWPLKWKPAHRCYVHAFILKALGISPWLHQLCFHGKKTPTQINSVRVVQVCERGRGGGGVGTSFVMLTGGWGFCRYHRHHCCCMWLLRSVSCSFLRGRRRHTDTAHAQHSGIPHLVHSDRNAQLHILR